VAGLPPCPWEHHPPGNVGYPPPELGIDEIADASEEQSETGRDYQRICNRADGKSASAAEDKPGNNHTE
jgi:hypothetical protein